MLMTINFEIKGQLAKLLATEDLLIENKNVETAMFNIETRVLTLPMWEKATDIVYDMLVGHEVGHERMLLQIRLHLLWSSSHSIKQS